VEAPPPAHAGPQQARCPSGAAGPCADQRHRHRRRYLGRCPAPL